MRYKEFADLPLLESVMVATDDGRVELYEGRKWIPGRFDSNIGIDPPAHGVGQKHAHVFGRKNDEIVVVNYDGTSSHGTKGRLHKDDADALRARGFNIPRSNIIEWFELDLQPRVLLG